MARRNLRQPVTAALVVEDAVIVFLEHDAQQTANFALVIDHESGRMLGHRKPSRMCGCRTSTGIRTTNSVPPPLRFRASTVPPWARTKPSTIESPNPVPPGREFAPR